MCDEWKARKNAGKTAKLTREQQGEKDIKKRKYLLASSYKQLVVGLVGIFGTDYLSHLYLESLGSVPRFRNIFQMSYHLALNMSIAKFHNYRNNAKKYCFSRTV